MIVTDGFRDALVEALGARYATDCNGMRCYPPVVDAVSSLVEAWIPQFFLECQTINLPCGHPALKPTKQVAVIDCACGSAWHLKAEAGKTWNAQQIS